MAVSDIDQIWEKLVQIHNRTKALYILAEELEPEKGKDFIQPILEFRSALDHIVRAKINEKGFNGSMSDPGYICDSMDKALGHVYRAFFDTADWMQDILRQRILSSIEPYPRECIVDVMPNYFSELSSKIDKITLRVSTIRQDKDISKLPVLEEVDKYNVQINELVEIHMAIASRINAMEDWMRREERSAKKKIVSDLTWEIIAGLIIAFVSSIVTLIACKFHLIIAKLSAIFSK